MESSVAAQPFCVATAHNTQERTLYHRIAASYSSLPSRMARMATEFSGERLQLLKGTISRLARAHRQEGRSRGEVLTAAAVCRVRLRVRDPILIQTA